MDVCTDELPCCDADFFPLNFPSHQISCKDLSRPVLDLPSNAIWSGTSEKVGTSHSLGTQRQGHEWFLGTDWHNACFQEMPAHPFWATLWKKPRYRELAMTDMQPCVYLHICVSAGILCFCVLAHMYTYLQGQNKAIHHIGTGWEKGAGLSHLLWW